MNHENAEVVLASLRALQNKIAGLEAERDHYRSLCSIHQRTLEDQHQRTDAFLHDERAIFQTTERTLQTDLARIVAECETLRREIDAEGESGLVKRMTDERFRALQESQRKLSEARDEVIALEEKSTQLREVIQRLRAELSTESTWNIEAKQSAEKLQQGLHRLATLGSMTNDAPSPTVLLNDAHTVGGRRQQPAFVPNGTMNSFNISSLRPRSSASPTSSGVIRGYSQLVTLLSLLKEEMASMRRRYAQASGEIAITLNVGELRSLADEMEVKAQQIRAVQEEMRVVRCNSSIRPVLMQNRSAERRVEHLHSLMRAVQQTRS